MPISVITIPAHLTAHNFVFVDSDYSPGDISDGDQSDDYGDDEAFLEGEDSHKKSRKIWVNELRGYGAIQRKQKHAHTCVMCKDMQFKDFAVSDNNCFSKIAPTFD